MMNSNQYQEKDILTLYKTRDDLILSLIESVNLIRDGVIKTDPDGLFQVQDLLYELKARYSRLSYLNINHILEFIFKDSARKMWIKDSDKIWYDVFKSAVPSEVRKTGIESMPTMFEDKSHLSFAMVNTIHILKSRSEDSVHINDILREIKSKMVFLAYMDRIHILELFFRDCHRNIMFNGPDLVKYKIRQTVVPPPTLYFGTLSHLSEMMLKKGIYSSSKHYVKLYSSVDGAKTFAKKFLTKSTGQIIILQIDSQTAYNDGLKFSMYSPGEYVVSEIKPTYITGEIL